MISYVGLQTVLQIISPGVVVWHLQSDTFCSVLTVTHANDDVGGNLGLTSCRAGPFFSGYELDELLPVFAAELAA